MTALPALPLQDELYAVPQGFAFAQAVDLLELMARRAGRPFQPLGQGSDPRNEALRLDAGFGLAFRPGPIEDLRAGAQPRLEVNFLGLGRSAGPLPEPYVEWIADQLRHGAPAMAEFLGIFQHRLLSLVYQCEDAFRIAAPYGAPQEGRQVPALLAILGLQSVQEHPLLAPILLGHAGLVAQQRHSMAGFLALLSSHFGVVVQGRESVGRWLPLPQELQTVLGAGGRNDVLGDGAVLGTRAWDQDGAVELRFAPLPLEHYLDMLPGGRGHQELEQLCAYYLGCHICCLVQLELAQAPGPGSAALGEGGPRLAYTSWLDEQGALPPPGQRRITLRLNDGAGAA